MSRVGRRPIEVPQGTKVALEGDKVKIEAKGKVLTYEIPEGFKIDIKENNIVLTRPSDSRKARSVHGTTRSILNNMVQGLNREFEKRLELIGVGYKGQVKGNVFVLDIGKSHTVDFKIPEGITIEAATPTTFTIKGIDKHKVGEVAAEIRALFPPEPYKGKGIRYVGEYVRHKQGKSIA